MSKIAIGLMLGMAIVVGGVAYAFLSWDDRNQISGIETSRSTTTEKFTEAMRAGFEGEVRDAEWATAVEGQWRDFYAGKPEIAKFGPPMVECKATICEIRVNATSGEKSTTWNSLMLDGIKDNAKLTQPSLSHVKINNLGSTTTVVHLVSYQRSR